MKFTKMSATGNDFIVIDNRRGVVRSRAGFARKHCPGHFAVGADGVILIERVKESKSQSVREPRLRQDFGGQVGGQASSQRIRKNDFRMRIFNPDGSEAEMCGNGARCAAVFAYTNSIAKKQMVFQTLAGNIRASVCRDSAVMGMEGPGNMQLNKKIKVRGKNINVHHIDTGVPHTVIIRSGIDKLDLPVLSPPIRFNRAFPRGTNVDYVQILNRHRIKMRTYERGVEAETLACGTGALASAIISALLGHTAPPLDVVVPGGLLRVYFDMDPVRNVRLEGEAKIVYEGTIKG